MVAIRSYILLQRNLSSTVQMVLNAIRARIQWLACQQLSKLCESTYVLGKKNINIPFCHFIHLPFIPFASQPKRCTVHNVHLEKVFWDEYAIRSMNRLKGSFCPFYKRHGALVKGKVTRRIAMSSSVSLYQFLLSVTKQIHLNMKIAPYFRCFIPFQPKQSNNNINVYLQLKSWNCICSVLSITLDSRHTL